MHVLSLSLQIKEEHFMSDTSFPPHISSLHQDSRKLHHMLYQRPELGPSENLCTKAKVQQDSIRIEL